MSQTEIHKGKLVPVKSISSHREFIDFIGHKKLTPWWENSIESFLEDNDIPDVTNYLCAIFLCESSDSNAQYKYCFYRNYIYQFENYNEYEEFEINDWTKDKDGSISFITSFYNGGTSFGEMLEDGIDRILDNKS